MRYEDPRSYEDSKFFNDPGKTQELSSFLIYYLISLNTFHITGVDKILLDYRFFGRAILLAPNCVQSTRRKMGAQNQNPRPIEKQLETLLFAYDYLNSTYTLHF